MDSSIHATRQGETGHQLAAFLLALCSLALVQPASAHAKNHARHKDKPPASARWLDLRDGSPRPVPTTGQRKEGFIAFQRSILERVYPSSSPRLDEMVDSVPVQATWGQYQATQLAVYPLRDLKQMQVTVSDLHDDRQHVLSSSEVVVRMVRYYGAGLSISHPRVFGVVPKTLEVAVPVDLAAGHVRPYWLTVHVPDEQPAGLYTGTITLKHATGEKTLRLSVDVIPVRLDEPNALYGTLCINVLANLWKKLPPPLPDGAVSHAGHDVTGATDLLRLADIVFHDQRRHGMTTMSLRSASKYLEHDGHPYLPDLDAAIDLYKRYRFSQPLIYCAGQLLKTNKVNRSASYREYDPKVELPIARKIAAYYTQRFREEGLPGIAFMPVEEPNLRSGVGLLDPPDIRQKLARTLTQAMKESGATIALTCTPDSVNAAIDYLDYWIVAYRKFSPVLYQRATEHHASLAIYANATMMGQGTYFTRFLFGYFVWANNLRGMLPWTYPVQPKRFPVNVDNRGEGALHLHDGFLGLDGEPIPTIQWELGREGIDDARYLITLERLANHARALKTQEAQNAAHQADEFLSGIRSSVNKDVRHYTFEDARTFEPQPQDGWDAERFEHTRQQAAALLKQLLTLVPANP